MENSQQEHLKAREATNGENGGMWKTVWKTWGKLTATGVVSSAARIRAASDTKSGMESVHVWHHTRPHGNVTKCDKLSRYVTRVDSP